MSIELFSLGKIYPSDFLKPDEQPRCEPVELKLVMEDNGLVRLSEVAPMDCMYGKYWYRSGINQSMKDALKDIVDSILKVFKVKENDIWLDIASNDGTLLSFVPKQMIRIGCDPAEDSFKKECEKYADDVIQDYFTTRRYASSKYGGQHAKIITSIAMFYDVAQPDVFIKDIHEVLDDNGLWILQLSYSQLMIQQCAFDNICHEHIYYYSLNNLYRLLMKHKFRVLDCQHNDVNGGSFRIFVMKGNGDKKLFGTQPQRDVGNFRVVATLNAEEYYGVEKTETWYSFRNRIEDLKEGTRSFIIKVKEAGGVIMGYGASTKGNTLLQYFGLDNSLVTAIADRSEQKIGLRTVGTNIPIISEDEMRKAKPDYLLVLPWHFISEFQERERDYLLGGGKMIVPCPSFRIITKDDL